MFLSKLLSSFQSCKRFNLFHLFFCLLCFVRSLILNVVFKSMLILSYKIAYIVLFFSCLKTNARNSKSEVTYLFFTCSVSFLHS